MLNEHEEELSSGVKLHVLSSNNDQLVYASVFVHHKLDALEGERLRQMVANAVTAAVRQFC